MSDCAHRLGCQTAEDGGPSPAWRIGLCAAHYMRGRRSATGDPGPPGIVTGTGPRRQPQEARCAEALLELSPARTGRGVLRRVSRGRAEVLWATGARARLPWPVVQGWERRGWVDVERASTPGAEQAVYVLPHARAQAQKILESEAGRLVRMRARPGSMEP